MILDIAHFLEERSIMGGREVIEGLRRMNHTKAILLEGDTQREVDAQELKSGQKILIKPGAGIPIDGVVIQGKTNIDQKSLTGEPQPEPKDVGDPVYAGTVNIDGQIIVQVEKEYVDTSFSKILNLLEEAEGISTPESRLIDRFMKYYIPFILVVAVAVALFTNDISKAIAILVVSCPCGHMLVSSAPMIAALSVAIKRGILIKNSKFIEELTEVNAVVFDKTGTITKGDLTLTDVIVSEGVEEEEFLTAALTVAEASTHPISRALQKGVSTLEGWKDFEVQEISGKGMIGTSFDGEIKIIFGNALWMQDNGVQVPETFAADLIGSVSYVSVNGDLLGALCFNDTKREDAKPCIQELKACGAEKVVVLTGDRQEAANRVCQDMDIDEVRAQLLPLDKLEAIKELKEEHIVLAVGDGINDALALKEADVGIAMGAMGSDLAIQSADIALMNNNLENIPFAVKLAYQTKSTIYANLVLSTLISVVMILFSALGVISAFAGAILHNVGAFVVLINSSRILKTELWNTNE
jgi:Cd2+/Zn2+-exporting ATPase/Cu+-exporting ATPase